jgi:oxygen-dependent protoporphyrinogen oxidase
LIDTLTAQLPRPPLLGAAAQQVMLQSATQAGTGRWLVRTADARTWPADVVVLACPAYRQAALLADLDQELANTIGTIPYNRVTVVGLGYRRSDVPMSVDGFGFIAPQRTKRDLLGVQWCSSLFPDRAPADAVLLRAMCGGWHRADVAGWEEPRLLTAMRSELQQAMGITAAPIFRRVIRWDRAIPQYHLGHQQRVQQIEQRLVRHPGLFVGGNAYHGVALNDCTEQATVLAEKIGTFLQNRQS